MKQATLKPHQLAAKELEQAKAAHESTVKSQVEQINAEWEKIKTAKAQLVDQKRTESRRQVEQAIDFAVRSNGTASSDVILADANRYLTAIDSLVGYRTGEVKEEAA